MWTRTPELLLLLALIALLSGCGSGGNAQPQGTFSHPLLIEANAYGGETPEGAVFVTPERFAALLDSGEAVLITMSGIENEVDQATIEEADARAAALAALPNDPDLLARLDDAYGPNDPDYLVLPNGSVLYRGIHEDAKSGREERWFVLSGLTVGLEGLVESKKQYESAENQHGIYALMYPLLPATYILDHQLPDPSEIEQESAEFLRNLTGEIGADWDQFIGSSAPVPAPDGYPASWRDEEGIEWRSDRDTPFDLFPTGLWSLIEFPLKWCATHVRDQGRRGTGHAFAITAAVEARFAATNSRWLNLSEQMLFNQANGFWEPHDFRESLRHWVFLERMVAIPFRFPFEASWDYNRSLFREVFVTRYIMSCWVDEVGTPYGGEFCSDKSHQSPIVCTRIDSREFCVKRDPAGLIPGDSQVRLTEWREIFWTGAPIIAPDGPVDPLVSAKAMLSVKVPVAIQFWVPDSFDEATLNQGIVPYDPTVWGGPAVHSMVMLGYIPNAALPPGTPPGSGGGYFICKNSFGTAWGDAGYCYVSDDWVRRYADTMQAINGVTDL